MVKVRYIVKIRLLESELRFLRNRVRFLSNKLHFLEDKIYVKNRVRPRYSNLKHYKQLSKISTMNYFACKSHPEIPRRSIDEL